MKVMKLALLGTAALAAASLSARADDLSALKAQIEALNSRIATLEAAPAVPAGYSLMTLSKAPMKAPYGFEAPDYNVSTVSVLPTADVPASTTVSWAGKVQAGFVFSNNEAADSDTEIQASAELVGKFTTDTAVGEVGAWIKFEDSWAGHSDTSYGDNITEAWGWWQMTPELQLGGGFDDDVSGIGHGGDNCSCYYISTVGSTGQVADDSAQMRLSYVSGPIAAAISVGSHDFGTFDLDDDYIVSGEVKYSGDSFSAEVAGAFGQEFGADAWQIGAGVTFGLDPITVSLSAGTGEVSGTEYVEASLWLKASLSDSVHAELGAGWSDVEFASDDTVGVYGGVYWSPVDKLVIGGEASWVDDGDADDEIVGALVTVFKF